MSNKDIKKGIAIQAKADAEKVEKLSKGLLAHKNMLTHLESGQTEIRDAMGIVLDDMSAGEAKMLYDLQVKKTPAELDDTEKRVLCSSIYTLLSSFGQSSDLQISFYNNLEQYLGISERKDNFNFDYLNNVDSHTDRLVILKAICSFLFLNGENFSFLREKESFSWLFAFASVKDISDICSAINSEYAVLGAPGVLGNYDPLLAPRGESQQDYYRQRSELHEDIPELDGVIDQANDDKYIELQSIINGYMSDEDSFGKGAEFSEKEFKAILPKEYERVAFDSLIAASKIEKGTLFFTTYAMYIRTGSGFKYGYMCLPYENICYDKITTSSGKKAGTRKINIPFNTEDKLNECIIDDAKIAEEKLRDLLMVINKSNCSIASSDREVNIGDLDASEKERLLAIAAYILKQGGMPLSDLFIAAILMEQQDNWDSIANQITDDDGFNATVQAFIQDIPYPSKRVTATQAMSLVLCLVSHANVITGKQSSLLTVTTENYIRQLDVSSTSAKDFNELMRTSTSILKEREYDEYVFLKENLESSEIAHKENILNGLELTIKKIESGIDFKAAKAIKNGAREVGDTAGKIMDHAKDSTLAKKLSEFKKSPEHVVVQLKGSKMKLLLPDGYEKLRASKNAKNLKSQFGDNLCAYSFATGNSSNVALFFNTMPDKAMNFSDVNGLIDGIHSCLSEQQGLIEVKAGKTKRNYDYIYSIVKNLPEEGFGVRYFLRMNLGFNGEIIEIHADFTETGMTGSREATCACFAEKLGLISIGEHMEGWNEDPYDPEFKNGQLMNLAEREGLDGLFAGNPLSQAREFILAIVNDELVIVKKENEETDKAPSDAESSEKSGDELFRELFDKECGCRRHRFEVDVESVK